MRFGAIFTAWGNSLQSFMTALPCYICLFVSLFFTHPAGILRKRPFWVTAALYLSLFIKSMIGSVKRYTGNGMVQTVMFSRHCLSRQKRKNKTDRPPQKYGHTGNLCKQLIRTKFTTMGRHRGGWMGQTQDWHSQRRRLFVSNIT